MKKKSELTKKEKSYMLIGAGIILLIITILLVIAYNNLFGTTNSKGQIDMQLRDAKIKSGDETKLTITIRNTGKDLLEGTINIRADDTHAVNITHPDENVLSLKLYPGEAITRIFTLNGETNAIRTDYKLYAEIIYENKTIATKDLILTVTND
ncbi:MAG: hypothetical protein ACLFN8_02235 [Candidatus Woesearchaeota archaeon]